MKRSRQREAILTFLSSRKDHPTADVIYANVKKEYPQISLGTVYRNLTLLTDLNVIQKVVIGDGVDHFDYNAMAHQHFVCKKCNTVIDIPIEMCISIDEIAQKEFDGKIEGHEIYFYGICEKCLCDKSRREE